MRKPLPTIVQWLLVAAFVAWSTILFVIIVGEDTPDMALSLFEFFLIKAMAFGSAYATYKVGKWCYNRSYFPEIVCKYIEETANEEDC